MANKHRIKGKMNEATGSVEKNVGKAIGNTEMEGRGQGREFKGKAENTWGKISDKADEATEAVKESVRGDDRPKSGD
jgi:uncharacterized protein YjbJ (UPF0337 family)